MAPDAATLEQAPTTTASSTPSTSPAAPAIQESAPSTSASQRPTSMLQAFEQAAAASEAAAVPEGSATTEQTAAPTSPAAPISMPETKGPIPFDVHHTALANARTKAIEERDTQWTQHPAIVRVNQIAKEISTNPIGHTVGMIQELFRHPTLGPQAKDAILQALGVSGNGRTAARSYDNETVAVTNERGEVIAKTYTDAGIQALVDQKVADIIGRELGPLKQDHQQRQQADRQRHLETLQQQETQRVNEVADATMTEIKELFGDHTELWGELAAAVQANPRASEVAEAMKLFRAKVLPTLHGQAKNEAIAQMKRSAQGNTANGAGTTTAPMKRPTNEKELAEYMRALDAGGAS